MPVPAVLATAAACGSLVTTVKSGWELSRMIRQKLEAREVDEDAVRAYRQLRRALHSGRMSEKEYDYWHERLLVAVSDKNLSRLRRIRAHVRMVYETTPRGWYHINRGNQFRRRHENDKRSRSVYFEPHRPTVYVPDPPQQRRDFQVPPSAGSIEYFPRDEGQELPIPHLARLQRSSSISYSPGEVSSKTSTQKSILSWRNDGDNERGRSRSREKVYDGSTGPSADPESVSLGYRSRR